MRKLKFPKVVRAAKAHDIGQWHLADALNAEAADRLTGADGLRAVAAELLANGIEYTTRYLRLLRQAAHAFPAGAPLTTGIHNRPNVVILSHWAAGNPDSLDVIVRAAERHEEDRSRTAARHRRPQRVEIAHAAAIADHCLAIDRHRGDGQRRHRVGEITGTRSVQSCPRRVKTRTRSPSRRQITR
jgi:hypothetical protein